MTLESIESFLRSRVPLYLPQNNRNDNDIMTCVRLQGCLKPSTISKSNEGDKEYVRSDIDSYLSEEYLEWGTGVSWLREIINHNKEFSTKYKISNESLDILKGLLKKKFREIISEGRTSYSPSSFPVNTKGNLIFPFKQTEVSVEGKSNSILSEVSKSSLKITDNPDTSTFMSILRIIDNGKERNIKRSDFSGNVYIKSAFVPMDMDASDVINASLVFLSSKVPCLHMEQRGLQRTEINTFYQARYFPHMPLITRDGETYHISQPCSLSFHFSLDDTNFKQKVFNLERVFYSTTSDYIGRVIFCPRCESDEKERRMIILGDNENDKKEFCNRNKLKTFSRNLDSPGIKKKRKLSSNI